MAVSFVRQLGSESGVQLNPLRDDSDIPQRGNADQVFAIVMRATRGRIDKPFRVNRGNAIQKLGKGVQMRVSALYEAWVHVIEALSNGAQEAVVQRMAPADAEIKWAVLGKVATDYTSWTTLAQDASGNFVEPAAWLLAVKHLECHNDGIIIEHHAAEKKAAGVQVANDYITLRIKDKDGVLLYDFYGSLSPTAKDDYGRSAYLPDVVAARTDCVIVRVGSFADTASIPVASASYGYDATNKDKWVKSGVLVCFDEKSTAYTATDYRRFCENLQYSQLDYAYIASGGTQSSALIGELAKLSFETNRQFRLDVPGNLSVDAAITFVEQLNLGANTSAYLMHVFWAPLQSEDPTGVNPKGYFGTSALNIAYACKRNAMTNAKGLAPKHYPIAGKNWAVNRSLITQSVRLTSQELNALADARINPVVHETFSGGGLYVFRDCLTSAPVKNSIIKLISTAEMASFIDDAVTRACKDVLQLPMNIAIKRASDFLTQLFEDCQATGWLVPSNQSEMGGKAWRFVCVPDESRPYDRMSVTYWLCYEGTNRQTCVSQFTVAR